MHLVVVEAYDGLLEPLGGGADGRRAVAGLGLPLAELVARLDGRATVLGWDEWLRYEAIPGAFPSWMPFPATRSLRAPGPPEREPRDGGRVRHLPVPADDPDTGRPLAAGLGPRAHGLLANSDPLMLASFCLERALEALHARDPFEVAILPMWGGIGYVAQLARATGAGTLRGVRFAVLATGTSEQRQRANGEGLWTRPAVTRRQMEDLSLALADMALCFGPLGEAIALRGRLPEASPPVRAPRRVDPGRLEAVAAAAERGTPGDFPPLLLFRGPLQGAAGALLMLDAVAAAAREDQGGSTLRVACDGPDMTFAPMAPRTFRTYWSGRAFARELEAEGAWRWDPPAPDEAASAYPVLVRPSLFEHLPDVLGDLGRGSAVLLSGPAADGLLPDAGGLPEACSLAGATSDAAALAKRLRWAVEAGPARLEAARRELCRRVVAAHASPERERRLDELAAGLAGLTAGKVRPPRLSRSALLLTDRRRPLREIAAPHEPPHEPPRAPGTRPGSFSVVVPCHGMGALLAETVESVWRSTRLPDELVVVDDGSRDAATGEAIVRLERRAAGAGLPLRVVRQRNLGLAAARNAGLDAVSGEFVSFQDGDDLIEPAFYRLALDLLQAEEGLGGVAAWSDMFGEGVPPGFWNAPQAELPLLLVENTVFVPYVARTAVLRELGGYDAGQRYNYEDWELALRLVASGRPIVTLPRYLQRYRVRGDSLLRTMSAVQNQVMRERLLERHRAMVERFAVEVAMLVEGELMARVHGRPRLAPAALADAGEVSRSPGLAILPRLAVGSVPYRATRAVVRRWRAVRYGGARGGFGTGAGR